MKTVDIVVPCYNEEAGLSFFYQETKKVLDTLPDYHFRFILIDDGSRDNTLHEMKKLSLSSPDVKYLSFSRNFGKEAAMYAGLSHTTGSLVIIMDADLQHPPAMIPDFLSGIEEGYDCCAAMRTNRDGESRVRSFFSRSFYKISNAMSRTKLAYGAVDYRVMTRQMVDSVLRLAEVERFSKGIFSWVGYDTKWYPYENVERKIGTTKWSFWGLFRYALDGITSFSVVPLRMVSVMGFAISLFAFVYIFATLIQTFLFGIDVPGYVTTLCAVLFLGGVVELSIGILGEYIAHMYMETKHRPIYIMKQSNFEESTDEKHHAEISE